MIILLILTPGFPPLGLFYGGYGAILLPTLGISDSYGSKTSEYYNAMGFFVLSKFIAFETYHDHSSRNTVWTVLNTIFLVASFSRLVLAPPLMIFSSI